MLFRSESREGVDRVRKIVENLREFTQLDGADWQHFNLERGLDSALGILESELRGKAEVVREYAGLPEVECIAAQINQVFMNLLVNAAHAIAERGTITLRTGFDEREVWVEVEDTGVGIKPENLKRVFEPFFTTRRGKGEEGPVVVTDADCRQPAIQAPSGRQISTSPTSIKAMPICSGRERFSLSTRRETR